MKPTKHLGIILFLISSIFAATVFAENADDKLVKQAYYAWCSAIGTAKGDAQQMVQFYDAGAMLLPTLSAKILINDNGGLNAYFAELTSNTNIKCVPQELITRVENNFALNNGLYTFTYTDKTGKTVSIPARFTFVYKKKDSKWMIITHHSSKLP